METPDIELNRGRVVLLEPNAPLRSAIVTLLLAERYDVEVTDSFEQVLELASDHGSAVALVAWQSMQGLLAEERRETLTDLTRRIRLVVMVPRAWARLLENTDLSAAVAALIPKPFQADDLLATLDAALAATVQTTDDATDSMSKLS